MSDNLLKKKKPELPQKFNRGDLTNLLSFFHSTPDLMFVFDPRGLIIEANNTAVEKLQYKLEELTGKSIYHLHPAELRNDAEKFFNEIVTGKRSYYPLPFMSKSGEPVYVETITSNGKWNGNDAIFSVSKDVSEKRQAEEAARKSEELLREQNKQYALLNEELKNAKEKAEESDRLKSAFLANMSHEIRTPMNGIMGFSMMLADPLLPNDEREAYIKIVNSSCEQLLRIINDIIDISKIEAGQIDLSESAFDLEELFNEVLSFYSSAARENGVELVINPASCNLPANQRIISDRTKVRQVLDNLLSNAVKFTHSGKIILRCELIDGFLQFEVEDTGIGIQPGLQNAIFERFWQVETTFVKKYGGTGLGLSITKAYIEKMGGEIWVCSELGKGSTFFFKLPYKPEITEETEKKPALKNLSLKRDMTILVVEDEEANWFYLHEILKNNVTTLHAENGKMAVEYVKQHPEIDLVLMDIKLPDINGLELTKMIKSICSELPVIAQSAYALSGDREKALEAGCSGYITKPVKRDDLLNLISVYSGG